MMEGNGMCEAPPRLPSEYYMRPVDIPDAEGGFCGCLGGRRGNRCLERLGRLSPVN